MATRSPDEIKLYEESRAKESAERTRATTDYEDVLHCFDSKTGREVWVARWPGRMVQWGQSSTPTADDENLYVVGSDREIHAVSQKDGMLLWSTDREAADELTEPVSSAVAINGSTGIVLCDVLMGIDLRTGKILWQKAGDRYGGFHSSPVIFTHGSQSMAIVNVRGGQTVGVDSATGDELWRLDSQAERSSPVISGNHLVTYGASRKAGLRCYELTDGAPRELWTWNRMADPGSTPAVNGRLVLVAGDKMLSCLDLKTGAVRWTERLDLAKSQYSSPIVIGDAALYADQGLWLINLETPDRPIRAEARFDGQGLLAAPQAHRDLLKWDAVNQADPAKAEQLWQERIVSKGVTDCTSPAFADGHVFLRLRTGLACYRLSADGDNEASSQLTDSIR